MSFPHWIFDVSPTERLVLGAFLAIIGVWIIRHIVISWAISGMDFLSPESPRFQGDNPPLITAIIPAKDEEASLAGCLATVRDQTYPRLEIVVVDDRSTDGTFEIAQSFAQSDPRFRVQRIESLPPGWTGKNHALQVAADEARGEWFWFLDADTRHNPENLAIVLEYAIKNNAAMASLLPEMRCETFWERVVQPVAGIVLMQSFPLIWVNDDRKPQAFANGQEILIRSDEYRAAGGHASVRDRFVEDIYLAKKVKGLGRPIRVAIGQGIGSTRMYASLGQLVRGWSRIIYDALGRKSIGIIGKILDPLVFSQSGQFAMIGSLVAILMGNRSPFVIDLLALSLIHHLVSYTVFARLYRLTAPGSRHVGWFPVANLVMDWVLFKALWMCLTGKVTWRGTAYGPVSREPAASLKN